MLLVRGLVESSPSEEVLLTGSGDGSVKLWRIGQGTDGAPVQMAKLQNGSDSVLSIAVEGSLLYCGLAGGALNIWNLESHQLVKRITKHTGDLWAIDIIKGIAISGDSNGVVKVCWSPSEIFNVANHPFPEIQFEVRRDRVLGCPRGHDAGFRSWRSPG